jgi:parvulin-like peptidyl-prolyl isomerase
MLEKLRQRSGQTIITILFGMIIVVFIINFGPQSNQTMGCGGGEEATALSVDGHDVKVSSWRYAANGIPVYLARYTQGMSRADRDHLAMDLLIQRELLAQEAERLGFVVNDGYVEDRLKAGKWLFLGKQMDKNYYFYPAPFCKPPAKPRDGFDAKKIFDQDTCEEVWDGRWIEGDYDYEKSADAIAAMATGLGLGNTDEFVAQQKREWLAEMSRALFMGSANVSREELTREFEHAKTEATIQFVKFRVPSYQAHIELDDAKIAAYLAEHEADVKKKYDAEAASYKATKPAVRLRQIFIAKAEDKQPAEDKPAEDKPADGKAEEAKQPPEDEVPEPTTAERKKADELHAQLVAGGDFAALARKHSQDPISAKNGGDLGWRRLDRPGLPDKKLTDALATLEPGGKPSEVLVTGRGYYILKVDAKREGDLSFDQVKHELATTMAKEHLAREEARKDAETALAELRAGKKLSELFEEAPAAPSQPMITPEQIQKLKEQYPDLDIEKLLQLQGGSDTGAIIVEGAAVPASWQGAEGAKPAAQPPATKPAAQPPATKPPAAKAGAGKPPAEPAKPAAAGAGDRPKPKLQKAGPFRRHPTNVAGVGESPELVTAIFDELEEGKPADRIFEVGDSFVIVDLVERTGPEDASFTKEEAQLREDAINMKAGQLLGGWLSGRCKQLAADGDLSYDKELVRAQDEDGHELPDQYQPCKFF